MLSARKRRGWSQQQAALKLGVSQPYLSLLEKEERPMPEQLARKAVTLYGLSAATLPVRIDRDSPRPFSEDELALELAGLGYPGLSHLKRRRRPKNPAELLLSALSARNLDSRLVEALPWVVWKYPDMDWRWLAGAARLNDLQNRLGFVTSVARSLAESMGERDKAALLGEREAGLQRSLLVREDTLCHDSLTDAERRWLRKHRTAEAKLWRLLTDLSAEQLRHAY